MALPGAAPPCRRQVELRHQPVGERRDVQASQADGVPPAPDLHSSAPRQVDGAPAVTPQHGGAGGVGLDLDGERSRATQPEDGRTTHGR